MICYEGLMINAIKYLFNIFIQYNIIIDIKLYVYGLQYYKGMRELIEIKCYVSLLKAHILKKK